MQPRKTIGFVTYLKRPELAEDDALTVEPLRERGFSVVAHPWDGRESADALDGLVLRSCWNYHLHADAFQKWIDTVRIPLVNRSKVVRWNLHKQYLVELGSKGIALPRTLLFRAGESLDLREVLSEAGIREAVVKPAISLSAYQTWRVRGDQVDREVVAKVADLVAERDTLVQEFIPEIEMEGEISCLFFDGRFSHAIRKRPKSGDFRSQSEHGGIHELMEPSTEVIRHAERILSFCPGPHVYARVDGVISGGRFLLMEVELLDPSLFLKFAPNAPVRFAEAIARAFS